MYEALAGRCPGGHPGPRPPRPGLVLVVGAGFGYHALYAAALGCRVRGWAGEATVLLRERTAPSRLPCAHIGCFKGTHTPRC